MSAVNSFELILTLVAGSILLELLADRLRLPPAAAFVLGGAALAVVPGAPEITFDPDLALVLFLPPLLMGSAYDTVWRDFRANLRIIAQLAVGAVAFTTAVVGIAVHWVEPGLPWAACFALGAIISPPDAVSAKAVLARVRLPHRMVVLLEGESLVNDASGLVLYRFAVAAALTGTFSVGGALLQFAVVSAGGVLIGAVVAFAGIWIVKRLSDPRLSVLVSLLTAWAAYIGADAAETSGVLSAVTTGLIVGWRQHGVMSATMRIQARAVWELVSFVLESLIFILIGLSLHGVLARLGQGQGGVAASFMALSPAIGVVVAATVLSRFAWIFPAVYLPRLLSQGLRTRDPIPPLAVPIIMSWAGMRGVVSLAIALALPTDFPGRDLILVTTFVVILVTVLVQGSTLAPLIRLLRVGGLVSHEPVATLTTEAAQVRVSQAQLDAIRVASRQDEGERHPRLLEQYTFRLAAAGRLAAAAGELSQARADHFSAVLAAVAAGRVEALAMHRAGLIHDSVLNALEHELDLEEVNARLRLERPPAS